MDGFRIIFLLRDSANQEYVTPATIPYIRGTSETIARILRLCNIQVAQKPMFTLGRLLTSVKDTNLKADKEQFIRPNAPSARPHISVEPAET